MRACGIVGWATGTSHAIAPCLWQSGVDKRHVMTYIVFMAGTHTTDTPAGKAHTMETLMTTDSIGEAIETARALHAMAIDAGNTDAAAIVYVVDMDHTDPLTGVTLRHEFEVIASAHRPRRGTVLFAGGALTPEA